VLTKLASIEELQAAILSVPGVVGAVVADDSSGPPTVRVWTDSSRDAAELQTEVRALVSRAHTQRSPNGPPPPVVRPIPTAESPSDDERSPLRYITSTAETPARRSGLGRGLDSLIPDAVAERPPGHLVSIDLTKAPSLDMIAIEESAAGVTVRAVDTARNVAEAKVIGGSQSINPAIVAAVAELLAEMPTPRLVSVELRDTEVAAVLVVTLELADTTIAAGAAVVQGGMPFTLGRATWAAIQSARP